MPTFPDNSRTVLLTPVCENCGHVFDRVFISRLPVLQNKDELILRREYMIDPDRCPNCGTCFDSIKVRGIEEKYREDPL